MKLTRLTVAVWKNEMIKRRNRGTSTDSPLTDNKERREAIEAVLLDVADICVLLAATQGDTAQTIAQLRIQLRAITNA